MSACSLSKRKSLRQFPVEQNVFKNHVKRRSFPSSNVKLNFNEAVTLNYWVMVGGNTGIPQLSINIQENG